MTRETIEMKKLRMARECSLGSVGRLTVTLIEMRNSRDSELNEKQTLPSVFL